jgi:hypothetical protein
VTRLSEGGFRDQQGEAVGPQLTGAISSNASIPDAYTRPCDDVG